MRAIGAVPFLLALAGCGGEIDDRPATWSYISTAIIQPSCGTSGCHSVHTANGGIRLDTREAGYTMLVDGGLVVPGQPDRSKLLYLLRGEEVWTMPPDGPIPDQDIELIELWILEGAKP